MKKLLIIALLFIGTATMAQKAQIKPDTTRKYIYYVKVGIADVNNLMSIAGSYKELIPYGTLTDAEKVTLQKNLNTYLADLRKRLQVDSVEVKK